MTTQLDTTGPGVEDYRSSRFEATVNGTPCYVYGYERNAGFTNESFTSGQPYEMSWLKFGANESATVVLSLADATPITSVTVYPKDVAQGVSITSGSVSMIVPTNKRLWVEVNGNRAEPLMVFAEPLKQTVPVTTTDWTATGVTASSVDTINDRIVFGSAHGLVAGDRVVVASSGDMPSDSGGAFDRWQVFYVTEVDGLEISIGYNEGDTIDLVGAGSGTIRVIKTEWTNTGSALYFGAGVHYIGRAFSLASSVTVYLDYGAVVVGGFKVVNTTGVSIKGPGQISGEHSTYEAILNAGFAARVEYAPIYGYGDSDGYTTNTVQGVTMFASPHFHTNGGVYSFRNVQLISPWTYNTDGFITTPQNSTTYATEVVDCFGYCGDDNVHVLGGPVNRTVSGSFFVNSSSAVFHFGYWPESATQAYSIDITNCDAMTLDNSDSAIFRCWMDGFATQASHGVFNVDVDDVRVWGPLSVKVFDLTNTLYPFDSSLDRDRRGQIAEWSFTDLWVEAATPGEVSDISGYDATSTPHDLSFTDVTFGGVLLTSANASTYITFGSTVYDVFYGTADDPIGEPPTTVEPGTGDADANTYCTVAFADAFHLALGNPSTWANASAADKEEALREAAFGLDMRYGHRWVGIRATTTQGLDWPRIGAYDTAGNLISSTTVPTRLKQACAYAALLRIQGYDIIPGVVAEPAAVASKSETVGPISRTTTYVGGGQPVNPQLVQLDRMLSTAGLVAGGGAGWGATDA